MILRLTGWGPFSRAPAACWCACTTVEPTKTAQLERGPSRFPRCTSHGPVPRAPPVPVTGVGGLRWFGFTLGLAVFGVQHGRPEALITAEMSGYGTVSVLTSLLVPLLVDRLPRSPLMVFSWFTLGATFVLLPMAAPSVAGVATLTAVAGTATP